MVKTISNGSVTTHRHDVQPVPFTISYLVGIWCNYVEHWAQLMENILPYYDPYLTLGIKERNLGIERELMVKLTGVSPNFSFQQTTGGTEKRIVRGELNFDVETFIYKQEISDISDIIHEANIRVIDIVSPLSSETITISAGTDVTNE